MRILVVTDNIPYPPVSGGPLRTGHLLRRMARENEVWLAALQDTDEEAEGVSHMLEFCREVITVPRRHRSFLAHVPGLVSFGIAGKPLELKFSYSPDLAAKIHDVLSTVDFDVVQIEHSHMALYIDAVPEKMRSKSVLTLHDIVFSKSERIARLEPNARDRWRLQLYARMMRRWEPRYAGRFARCIAMSEADRQLLLNANPNLRVDLAPNGVDTTQYQVLPDAERPPALIFVGNMSYAPCVDAMLYFSREILPLIRQTVPDVQLWIVGIDPAPEILELRSDSVHVTGRVEDLVPFYQQSVVSIVPLRAGGGTRLKILEAMALGRPVVSTTIGSEGLEVQDGRHLLVSDDPAQFAERVVRLLRDPNLRRQMAASARELVVSKYDWDVIARQVLDVFADVARPGDSVKLPNQEYQPVRTQ